MSAAIQTLKSNMQNSNLTSPLLTRIVNSHDKKNPVKNLNIMIRLNPFAKNARMMALSSEEQDVKAKKKKLDKKRKPMSKEAAKAIKVDEKSWYRAMISHNDYNKEEAKAIKAAGKSWYKEMISPVTTPSSELRSHFLQ